MIEIIKVKSNTNIGGSVINTVDARELHKYLGVGKDFATWIKDRVDAYSFEENVDYLVLSPNLGNNQRGRPTKEYHVSLDMAKELSMVDRSDKGKQVRKYFIDCEKRVNSSTTISLNDPYVLRKALLEYTEQVIALQQTIKEQEPKVEFHNMVTAHDDLWYSLGDAAKLLGVGRTTFSRWLKDNNYMGLDRMPYQQHINNKLMGVKLSVFKENIGNGQVYEHPPQAKPYITGKGLTSISAKMYKEKYND